MKKILYCMHVGWNWIEQRPHFIARELAKHYEVTVISDHNYRVKGHSAYKDSILTIKEFYKIPMFDHWKFTRSLNKMMRTVFYRRMIRKIKPDVIYVMTPWAFDYIHKDTDKNKIIYDCMDDMIEFSTENAIRNIILKKERELIGISDVVFASSQNLIYKLQSRYGNGNNIHLIRNGYNAGESYDLIPNLSKEYFTIIYFGTIAEWFDFDILLASLNLIKDIRYIIYGPVQSGTIIPEHERLIYGGIVRHADLKDKVSIADCFIMPFKMNALIESVDPVKLYEYIRFRKNIVSIQYDEIERFKNFVFFYKDQESFIKLLNRLKENNELKYNRAESKEFLENSTWEQRGAEIKSIIDSMF